MYKTFAFFTNFVELRYEAEVAIINKVQLQCDLKYTYPRLF